MLDQIHKKIKKIEHYVSILRELKDDCEKRILKDEVYRGAVIYYLYVTADSCISLAELIVKWKEFEEPQSYAETIDILGDHGVLPGDFAYEFARIASFRNFLAHDYERTDYIQICKTLLSRLSHIDRYLQHIRDFI